MTQLETTSPRKRAVVTQLPAALTNCANQNNLHNLRGVEFIRHPSTPSLHDTHQCDTAGPTTNGPNVRVRCSYCGMIQLVMLLLLCSHLPTAEARPTSLVREVASFTWHYPLLATGILLLSLQIPGISHLARAIAYRCITIPLWRRRLEWYDQALITADPAPGSLRAEIDDYVELRSTFWQEISFLLRSFQTALARWVREDRRQAAQWRLTPLHYQQDLEARLAPFEHYEWGRRFRDTLVQQLGDFSSLPPHELFISLTRHFNNLLRDRVAARDPLPRHVEEALMEVLRDMRNEHVPRPLQNSR